MVMHKQPTAFVSLEAVAGLALLIMFGGVLFVAIVGQNRAATHLAESRAAIRQAEEALLDLQTGGDGSGLTVHGSTSPGQSPSIRITPLPSAESPPGWTWVKVDVQRERRGRSLVGLVPAKSVESVKPVKPVESPSTQGGAR